MPQSTTSHPSVEHHHNAAAHHEAAAIIIARPRISIPTGAVFMVSGLEGWRPRPGMMTSFFDFVTRKRESRGRVARSG